MSTIVKPAFGDQATETRINQCEAGWKACRDAQLDLKALLDSERRYATLVEKQAVEAIKSEPATVPWYVWLVVGAAGGVILTRGLR
jgi:hypothetical protein